MGLRNARYKISQHISNGKNIYAKVPVEVERFLTQQGIKVNIRKLSWIAGIYLVWIWKKGITIEQILQDLDTKR